MCTTIDTLQLPRITNGPDGWIGYFEWMPYVWRTRHTRRRLFHSAKSSHPRKRWNTEDFESQMEIGSLSCWNQNAIRQMNISTEDSNATIGTDNSSFFHSTQGNKKRGREMMRNKFENEKWDDAGNANNNQEGIHGQIQQAGPYLSITEKIHTENRRGERLSRTKRGNRKIKGKGKSRKTSVKRKAESKEKRKEKRKKK